MTNPKLTYLLLKYGQLTNPKIVEDVPVSVLEKAYRNIKRGPNTLRDLAYYHANTHPMITSTKLFLNEILFTTINDYYNNTSDEEQQLDLLIDTVFGIRFTSDTINNLNDKLIIDIWYEIGQPHNSKEYDSCSDCVADMRKYLIKKIETTKVLRDRIYDSFLTCVKAHYRKIHSEESTIV